MNFDTGKFIVEIQQREAIWNCEGAVYKNRDLQRKQWEELVDIFGKEEMTTEAKIVLVSIYYYYYTCLNETKHT